jgi:ribosome maturation factor RimP
MSEVTIDKQLEGVTIQVKSLNAQLEATKEMFNEQVGHNVHLRTAVKLLQGVIKEVSEKNVVLESNLKNVTVELDNLKANPADQAVAP